MHTRGFAHCALAFVFALLGCSDLPAEQPSFGFTPPAGAGAGGAGLGGGGMGASVAGASLVAGAAGQAGAGAGLGGGGNGGAAGNVDQTAGGSAGSAAAAGSAGAGGMPSEGQLLYDAACKMCHGEQGVGGMLAPELQHPVRDYATWVVRNGRAQSTYPKPMDKWGPDKLPDAQLMAIFDYLSLPPKPMGGQALYLDYCSNCHGRDAKGGPTGRNLLSEVDKVEALVRGGKNAGQFQLRKDFMPVFAASTLSDDEVTQIRDYIDSL